MKSEKLCVQQGKENKAYVYAGNELVLIVRVLFTYKYHQITFFYRTFDYYSEN